MQVEKSDSIEYNIYIGGRVELIKVLCSEFCTNVEDCCVTVTETEYIYGGGQENGVIVGVRNFPKVPKKQAELFKTADRLGEFLMERACQKSYMISGPSFNRWYSK